MLRKILADDTKQEQNKISAVCRISALLPE